jgi:LytS/YehU family sensor histidine kinase
MNQLEERAWRVWLLLPLAVALQTTWLARWQPLGAHVDLPLLTVVSAALVLGARGGAAYGLAAGLLTATFAAVNPGSFALSRLVVGALCGLFDRGFSHDNPLAPPLCAAGATLLASLIFLFMSPAAFSAAWWLGQTLTAMLLHAVLIWPVQWLVTRLVVPPPRPLLS